MSKLFGNKKVKQKANSITTSDDGKKSTNANESIKDERAVPVEALTTQPQGHLYGMVTIEHDKGRDMTKEIKKPFFKGYVLFDNKKFEDLSPSKIRKYETPITTMVERDYMIPEFSKFSDAEEFVDRKKDMKEIINENYRKICNDVDHIIKDFERKRDLQEFEEQRKMEEQKEAISTEALVNSLMHADPDEKVVLPDEAYSNDTKENDIPTSYFAG